MAEAGTRIAPVRTGDACDDWRWNRSEEDADRVVAGIEDGTVSRSAAARFMRDILNENKRVNELAEAVLRRRNGEEA